MVTAINNFFETIIEQGYDLYILIGVGALSLLFFVISFIKAKKLPVFGLILILLAALGYGFVFVVNQGYISALDSFKVINIMGEDIKLISFELLLLALVFVVELIIVIASSVKAAKKVQILKLLPSNIDTNIYAYMNKKSKVFYLTPRFYSLFSEVENKKRNWKKAVKQIIVNREEKAEKEFKKFIRKNSETFELDVVLTNDEVVSLTIEKRPIQKNDKTVGYVLINQRETIEVRYKEELEYQFKNRLYAYFDLMDEAVCFFDTNTGKYNLSPKMMELLSVGENEMSLAQFEALVVPEDLEAFRKREATPVAEKIYFKVKTINDVEWFEENTYATENEEFYLVRRANFLQYRFAFKGYEQLLNDLSHYYEEKKRIGLILLSLDNIKDLVANIGRDFSDVLIVKYFTRLADSSLRGKYKTYKVSNLEFALVVERMEDFESIIRDLSKQISDLTSTDVYFNEIKYTIKASVGLVDSKEVLEPTITALMKAVFDALHMASDPAYANNYCIYYAKTPSSTTYRFEDYKIDLTDKDVDDILK